MGWLIRCSDYLPKTTRGKDVTVLVIDQDAAFRSSIAAMLRAEGCVVQEYEQVRELPPLDTVGEFSLVITDHIASEKNGLAFADAFHHAHPSTPILLLTPYWSLHLASEVAGRSFITLRRTPIGFGELNSLVRYLGNHTTPSRLQSTVGNV